MTQAIAQPHATPAPSGTVLRVALAIVVAALLLTAFATGRATAPDEVIRTIVTAPAADSGPTQPANCPPGRPPVC